MPPVRAKAQNGEAGVTYFADESSDREEIVCLDCNVVLAQGPLGFMVRWQYPVLCFPYNHRVIRRLIPVAATEASYFNSEDDEWYEAIASGRPVWTATPGKGSFEPIRLPITFFEEDDLHPQIVVPITESTSSNE